MRRNGYRPQEDLRAAAPLLIVAAVCLVAAVTVLVRDGLRPGTLAVSIGFALFIAVGEVARIVLPGNRESAPFAEAGSLAFALLPAMGAVEMEYGIGQVVAVVAAGTIIGWLPRLLARRPPDLSGFARHIIVISVVAAIFRPLLGADLVPHQATPLLALAMVGVALLGNLLDAALSTLIRCAGHGAPPRTVIVDELRSHMGIGSAIAATGVLIALAAPFMGWWAVVVFACPLLLTQFSFRRYAAIRATYLQTIRSLSKVTEVGGYTETGHAQRVSRMALRVGRELGLSERELLDLEYAALMHDIGQLSLPEPIPGGATTIVSPAEQRRIAELGAAVIRETGVLDRVAEIVERQADPYRPRHGEVDETLPMGSRIIRAANAYDDMVGASLESDQRQRALQRLRLGMTREYDARVVETLSHIVERELALVS